MEKEKNTPEENNLKKEGENITPENNASDLKDKEEITLKQPVISPEANPDILFVNSALEKTKNEI